MNPMIQNLMQGLVIHFLQQKTVEQAIEEGRQFDLPEELLASLPGMMFELTSAACAVREGQDTFDNRVDMITRIALSSEHDESFSRDTVVQMLEMTQAFIEDIFQKNDADQPLPPMTEPWFFYQMDQPDSIQ